MRRVIAGIGVIIWTIAVAPGSGQQRPADVPSALADMVNAERAFAARGRNAGWKQAFLEYFADDAVGFDGEQAGPAKAQIRAQPDPPKDLQLVWEPRYGDISASGDLGYLTGPVTTFNPARNQGMPRPSTYASVWKRQADGTFKVEMDAGIPTPQPVPFAPGFTRAPQVDRSAGRETPQVLLPSLLEADRTLTAAAGRAQADAYRNHLAPGARVHRVNVMPIVGETEILAWLRAQPPYVSGETRFAEAARSGDLGYTWGSYSIGSVGSTQAEQGFYVRVWVRSQNGAWKVALDVLQPQ